MAKVPGERTPQWWDESRVSGGSDEPPPPYDDEPPYDPEYDEPPYDPEYAGPAGDPGEYVTYQPESVHEVPEPTGVPGGYSAYQPEQVYEGPESVREQAQEQLNQKFEATQEPVTEPTPEVVEPESDTRDWARRVYEEHMAEQKAERARQAAEGPKTKFGRVEEALSAKWDARVERDARELEERKKKSLRHLKNDPTVSQFYRTHPKLLRPGKDGQPLTPGERVQREIATARQDHLNRLKLADRHVAKRDRDDRLSEISEESRLFITVRLSTMSRDLYSGQMSLRSGLMSFAFMYAANKDFRNLVNSAADRTNPVTLRNKQVLEKLETKRNDAVVKGEFLSEKDSMKLRELRARVNYGRAPYDAYSAGMAEIALTSNCYERLREPGVEQDKVLDEHRRDVARLYEMAGEDGVPAYEVARHARIIASEMVNDNPSYRAVFDQTSHGQLRPAVDLDSMPLDRMGLRQYGDWNGEMITRDGQILQSGSLTVRPVLSPADHRERISEHVSSQIMASTTPEQLYERMSGYLLGAADYERMALDTYDFDEETLDVLDQANLHMFQMEQDGMDSEQRTDIYADGLAQAMTKVAHQHPALDQAFQTSFGKDWSRTVRRFVKDPSDFLKRAQMEQQRSSERAPQSETYAPEPPPRPEALDPAPPPQYESRVDEPEMSL